MYCPGQGKLELISNRRHFLCDSEGPVMLGREFRRLIREFQVLRFQPYLISRCELIRGRCLGALLRLTAIRAVMVLYKPKDQQGCQRRYTTNETLATMARKCHKMRRMRMRSKEGSSCARVASRYF